MVGRGVWFPREVELFSRCCPVRCGSCPSLRLRWHRSCSLRARLASISPAIPRLGEASSPPCRPVRLRRQTRRHRRSSQTWVKGPIQILCRGVKLPHLLQRRTGRLEEPSIPRLPPARLARNWVQRLRFWTCSLGCPWPACQRLAGAQFRPPAMVRCDGFRPSSRARLRLATFKMHGSTRLQPYPATATP